MADNPFDLYDEAAPTLTATGPASEDDNPFSQFDSEQPPQPAAPANQPPAPPTPVQNMPGVSVIDDPEMRDILDQFTARNIREGTDKINEARGNSFIDGVTDPQQYLEAGKGVVPGAIKFGGTTLKGAGAVKAAAEVNVAKFAHERLAVLDRLERGESAQPQRFGDLTGMASARDATGYASLTPAQRAAERARLERLLTGYTPTPAEQQSLFKAGEKVTEYAKTVLPPAPGYEEAVGRQLGEGIGSLVAGLPAGWLGRIPAAAFFGAGGAGEAVERAIEFDRKEKKAGRPGLTQDQINASALWGVAPGTTDLLPIETLFGRLKIPAPFARLAARAVGRIGGQAFVEGMQEGGQQFLQNLIAQEIYNPEQALGEGVVPNIAMGGGVGAAAQSAKEAARLALRNFAGRRGGSAPGPSPSPAAPAGAPQAAGAPGQALSKAPDAAPAPQIQRDAAPETRAATREQFNQYLALEDRLASIPDDMDAPPELINQALDAEEAMVETFRATGLPGDNLARGTRPINSMDDVRRAFDEATPEEINEFWQGKAVGPAASGAALGAGAVAPSVAGGEKSAAAPAGVTFKTAKGSSYTVHEDGTTTRDKAFRPEHGAAEQGIMPRSEATFYVTPEDAIKLGEFQTSGSKKSIEKTSSGAYAVKYLDGPSAGKFEKRTVVQPKTQPEVGLTPVEIWKGGQRVHFGNAITEVGGARDLTTDFLRLISGPTPRDQWAKTLGVSEDELMPHVERAIASGLLRVDRNGVVRRNAAAVAEMEPEVEAEGQKIEQAIEAGAGPLLAPGVIEGENVTLTPKAIDKIQELKAIAEEAVAKILPRDVRIEVVDNIAIDRLAHEDELLALRALHASPYDFDSFSTDHIGTGEGAQAFGWGLYFAESDKVMGRYALSVPDQQLLREAKEAYSEFDDPDTALEELLASPTLSDRQKRFLSALAEDDWFGFDYPHQAIRAALRENPKNWDASQETLDAIKGLSTRYEVNINAEPEDFIDWDAPLMGQPVFDKLAKMHFANDVFTDAQRMDYMRQAFPDEGMTGADYYRKMIRQFGSDKAASEFMAKSGVAGIRYLDQASRRAGEGTRNIVVFDDKLVEVVSKDGKPVSARAAAPLFSLRSSKSAKVSEGTEGESDESGLQEDSGEAGQAGDDASQSAGEGEIAAAVGGGGASGASTTEGRILRQESATLRADGSIRAGRVSGKAAASSGLDAETLQPVGTSEFFDAPGLRGVVTAMPVTDHAGLARRGAPASEYRLANLTYRLYAPDAPLTEAQLTNFQPNFRAGGDFHAPLIWAGVSQHMDGTWEVSMVQRIADRESAPKGMANKLYAAIEKDLGIRMSPSGILSKQGLAMWQKRSPESVKWHQWSKHEGYFISPRRIKDNIARIGMDLADIAARPDADPNKAEDHAIALSERKELIKLWTKLPLEARGSTPNTMFSLRQSPSQPRTPTEVRVLHGTPNGLIDAFDPAMANPAAEGAVFFTASPDAASAYSGEQWFDTMFGGEMQPAVYPTFIETKNFKTIDFKGQTFNDGAGPSGGDLNAEIALAKKEGHAGLIVKNVEDTGGPQSQYVTWTKGTVRSALSEAQMFSLRGFYSPAIRAAGASAPGATEALGQTNPDAKIISIGARAIEAESRATGKSEKKITIETARHEALEFFLAKGFIKPDEWATLVDVAVEENWIEETGVRDAYTALVRGGARADGRFALAGKKAATADLKALGRAEEMERSGKDRRSIWDETGWYRGVDGQWRFEINDNRAGLGEAFTLNASGFIQNLFRHPDLYRAYKSQPFRGRLKTRQSAGNSQHFSGDDSIVAQGMDLGEIEGKVLHEIQHGIQDREGFARGTNWFMPRAEALQKAKSIIARTYGDVLERLDAVRSERDRVFKEDGLSDEYYRLNKEFVAVANERDAIHEKTGVGFDPKWLAYFNTAGEVEARNVERRAKMTPEERRATPPWETQDVADEDQFVGSADDVQMAAGMSEAELEDLILKESIMVKYGEYEQGNYKPKGIIAKVFKRIKDFLDRLRNSLKSQGFQRWEDIFQKMDAGEMRQRYEARFGRPAEAAQTRVTSKAVPAGGRIAAMTLPGLAQNAPLSPAPAGPTPGRTASAPGSLVDIQRNLRRKLGLTVASGRLDPAAARVAGQAGGKLMGQFDRQTEVIRLRTLQDIDTEAHEVAHALESRYAGLAGLQQTHSAELGGVANLTGQSGLSEGFAEFFRLYLTNPPAADAHAPKFRAAFEDFLETQDAQTLQDIQEIQAQYQQWRNASSAGRITAAVKSGVPDGTWEKIRAEYDRGGLTRVGGMFWAYLEQVYKSRIDRTNPIRVLVERIARQAEAVNQDIDLSAWRNPQAQARKIPAADGVAYMDITRGVGWENSAGRGSISLRDALSTAFGGTGYEHWTPQQRDDFGAYLIARRGRWLWQRHDMDPARNRGRMANPPQNPQPGDWYFDTMTRQRRVYLRGRWETELTRAPDKHTRADHEQAVADLEAANPQFAVAAQMVYQFNRDLALKRFQAGLDSQEEFDYKNGATDYVPWFRDMTDAIFAGTGVSGRKVQGKFKIRGSYRDFINPVEGIIRQVYDTNREIAVNKPKLLLAQLADTVQGAGKFAEIIPATRMVTQEVRVREALAQAAKQEGLPPEDAKDMISAVAAMIGDDAVATLFRVEQAGEAGDAILHYMEGGELKMVQIHDDERGIARDILGFFEALKHTPAADSLFGAVTAAVRVPQKAITSSLGFVYRNLIRDAMQASVLQAGYFPIVSNIRTVASNRSRRARGEEGWGELLARHGGIMGGIGRTDVQQIKQGRVAEMRTDAVTLKPWERQFWKQTVNPWHEDFWRWAEWSEANARQTLARISFDRAIKDVQSRYPTMPADQQTFVALESAVQRSRDYTDYSRMGDAPSQAFLNRMVMFLNPSLQGPDKMIRAMFLAQTNEGRFAAAQLVRKKLAPLFDDSLQYKNLTSSERDALKDGLRAWVTILIIAHTHLLLEIAFNDPDELEDKSKLERATSVSFTINGVDYRIPRGFDLVNFTSNMVKATYDSWQREDPTAWPRFRETLTSSLLPAHSSPILDLYSAVVHGRNTFFGTDIEPTYLKGVLPEDRYKAYTSGLAKDIAKAVNESAPFEVSPLMVEYVMNLVGADWSRDIMRAYDVADPNKPALRWQEYPFLRAARGLRGTRGAEEFWKLMGQDGAFTQAGASYREEAVKGKAWSRDDIRKFFEKRLKDEDAKAYSVMLGHYNAEQRRLHPMERAREFARGISGVMRDVASNRIDVPVTSKMEKRVEVSREVRAQALEILGEIGRREYRNALIALKRPGYENREPQPVKPYLNELKTISPEIHKSLIARITNADGSARVYDYDRVRALWPETRQRLLSAEKRERIIETQGDVEFGDLTARAQGAKALGIR